MIGQKPYKGKVKLAIDIPKSEKKIGQAAELDEGIYVRPVYSTKNARRPHAGFSFEEENIDNSRQRRSKKL